MHKRAEKIMESCPRYEIDVTFYPEEQSFTAHQNIIITNDKATEFKELIFTCILMCLSLLMMLLSLGLKWSGPILKAFAGLFKC